MAANKLPYFPFHVDDYLSDPAVMMMDADTEGCYIRLLANMWKSPTPGIVTAGLAGVMGGLHRVSAERREEVLRQLAKAFDITKAGRWTQRRMVVEYKRVSRVKERQTKSAQRLNTRKRAYSNDVARSPSRSSGVEVEVEVEVEKRKRLFSYENLEAENQNSLPGSYSVNGFVKSAPVKLREQLAALACWLVETGTDHPPSVIAVLENYVKRLPKKPKAYYAVSGTTRNAVIFGAAADRAERGQARLKRQGLA